MKKQLLVAAVIFAAVSAQASKARLNSLGNSPHLVDIQEVFTREPDQALNYEAATVEFGGNSGAATEAEGGFIRKMGDSAWSMYLGRSSTTYKAFTTSVISAVSGGANDTLTLTSIHEQANPLQLTYASKMSDVNWGAGLIYVGNSFKDQTVANTASFVGDIDQSVMGLLVGANNGVWDAQLRLGLAGETKSKGVFSAFTNTAINALTELKVNSTSSIKASGGYLMDTMYFYGAYDMRAGEVKGNGTKLLDAEITETTLGVVNSHKKDGVDFFYGVSLVLNTTKEDVGNTKDESTLAPLIVGVEAEVASWMTLRGSLTQNLSLVSSSKPDGASSGAVADSTVTALGAGFKWGKANIDAVVSTGTNGNFGVDNGGAILGQASVTYNF